MAEEVNHSFEFSAGDRDLITLKLPLVKDVNPPYWYDHGSRDINPVRLCSQFNSRGKLMMCRAKATLPTTN